MSKENAFFKMEMLVLLVLKKQDCYGYEIANYMKEQTDGIIDMNLGTLYPVLYRLVNDGCITGTDKIEGRRMRVYYHLEPTGEEVLNNLTTKYQAWVSAISKLM